jgi:hypothetical protein
MVWAIDDRLPFPVAINQREPMFKLQLISGLVGKLKTGQRLDPHNTLSHEKANGTSGIE